jgi:ribosomal-protein-alanine N-acetyltransferase
VNGRALTAFPVLQTERLQLREIIDADAEALYAIHGDPQLMRWFGSDPLPNLDAARALVKAFASWRELANPGTRWGLELKDRPGLIGSCGLFSWNRQWRKCSVGYELAGTAQGQGLMRETLAAVLAWGYGHMGVNRIEALIHPANLASIKLVRGLGFVEEGRLREVGHWGGRHHDMLQFSLLRREWTTT